MFPNEILIRILNYLDWDEIIQLTSVCRHLEQLIKCYPWSHQVTLFNTRILELLTMKYQFSNYRIQNSNITDDELIHLKGMRIVDLFSCNKITDAGLVYLKGIRTVDLTLCKNITDAGLEHLAEVHTIDLSGK